MARAAATFATMGRGTRENATAAAPIQRLRPSEIAATQPGDYLRRLLTRHCPSGGGLVRLPGNPRITVSRRAAGADRWRVCDASNGEPVETRHATIDETIAAVMAINPALDSAQGARAFTPFR